MEYGSICYDAAAQVHLNKLDAVQRRAERLSGFKFNQSLQGRRDAASFGLTCKILDGKVIPSMKSTFSWVKICDEVPTSTMKTRGVIKRNDKISLSNLENTYRKVSLESFKRSYACTASKNFDKIPQEILKSVHSGKVPSWSKVMKTGQRILSTL